MLNTINELRVAPKSFIPRVEAYIKELEKANPSNVVIDTTKLKMHIVVVSHKGGATNDKILEAKKLIIFLSTQKSLNPLGFNSKLYFVAKKQVMYLDSIGKVSHDGPNGQTLADRTKKLGSVVENVCSVNTNIKNTVVDCLMQFLLDIGTTDKPHRANLFNENAKEMAMAKAGSVWVQDFIYTLK
jgi:uncharacterized protein YkwD